MSGRSPHRVDVVVPTRNRPALTRDAIESIRAQTFADWRCYVVDDASDDGAADEIERHIAGDDRIEMIRRPVQGGGNPARQTGLDASSAPLVALCDSDDVWVPEKLERQVDFWDATHARGTPVDVVLCWHDAVDVRGRRRGKVLRPSARRGWHPFTAFNTSTPLIARAALERSGGFAPREPYTARTTDHVELFLRLLEEHAAAVVPELLVHCRHHSGHRNSDAQRTRAAADEAAALLAEWDDRLAHQPATRAWLRGWVAGRYLELGDARTGLPFLRQACRADGVVTGSRIAAHYAPLLARCAVRPAARR